MVQTKYCRTTKTKIATKGKRIHTQLYKGVANVHPRVDTDIDDCFSLYYSHPICQMNVGESKIQTYIHYSEQKYIHHRLSNEDFSCHKMTLHFFLNVLGQRRSQWYCPLGQNGRDAKLYFALIEDKVQMQGRNQC